MIKNITITCVIIYLAREMPCIRLRCLNAFLEGDEMTSHNNAPVRDMGRKYRYLLGVSVFVIAALFVGAFISDLFSTWQMSSETRSQTTRLENAGFTQVNVKYSTEWDVPSVAHAEAASGCPVTLLWLAKDAGTGTWVYAQDANTFVSATTAAAVVKSGACKQ